MNFLADKLSGWDFLVCGLIVAFTEYVIKLVLKDEKYKNVWRLAPIVLGLAVYVVTCIIQKGDIASSIIHGLSVGLASAGSYSSILKAFTSSSVKGIEGINEAVKEAVEDK